MSYYNQPSSYPGGPSTYPGGPSFPEASQGDHQSYGQSPYGSNGNNTASSYYDAHPTGPNYGGSNNTGMTNYHQNPDQQIRYDERGNPIPQGADGERGLGTMALGAIGGVAANKMSGGHHSSLASAGGGAMLAQGAKMAFEMFNNKNKHGHHGHGHHGHGHHGHGHHGKHDGPFGGLQGLLGKH